MTGASSLRERGIIMTRESVRAACGTGLFPPRTPADIDAYPEADLMDGYLDYEHCDPEPGPNRSPGYRWGWQNRKRDSQREDDGHDAVRHAHIAQKRRAAISFTPTTTTGLAPSAGEVDHG